ncbi:MAG: hypothetical protein R3C20_09485 [Planctomycetaceae bacterium]
MNGNVELCTRRPVHRRIRFSAVLLVVLALGCTDSQPATSSSPAKPRTTDKVDEFNPNAGREVVSNEVRISNPITGALEAYQPLKRQIAGLGIDHAVGLFQALEGRYPKDFDEFMTRIIKENNIRLPSLPQGMSYQYDVANHKLVVVRDDTGQSVD